MSVQPHNTEAYTEAGNPVSRNPAEQKEASHDESAFGKIVPQRRTDQRDAIPTSLAIGARGGGPVTETEARATSYSSQGYEGELQNENVNAEQMATLSEGKVADAVERKSGTQKVGTGEVKFEDFASDLDRKKAEQAEAREAVKSARREGYDVDGGTAHVYGGVEVD